MTADPTERRGRADLHIHTLASDGTASVAEILDRVEREAVLDVIAITDHERIDAALAARRMAEDGGMRVRVVVGEEISTRGGHLLGLFLERPVPRLRSLRWSVAAVHEQGGIAIPAHPLVPYPLCAQGFVLRGLLDDPDPARPAGRDRDVQPHRARPLLARAGRPLRRGPRPVPDRQQRRPRGRRRGIGLDELPGPDRRTTSAPRSSRAPRPITAASTAPQASSGRSAGSCGSAAATRAPRLAAGCAATARAATTAIRAGTTGRRASSPRTRSGTRDEDRPRLPVRVPAARRRDPARPVPLREPAPARPRRPHPDVVPRAPARVRGRRHPPRQGVLDAGQRVRRDGDAVAPLHLAGAGGAGPGAVRRPPLPRAVRAVPLARSCCASRRA